MTRAVAQTPSDLVLSSTTESQEAIEHAVGENWKEPFIPAAQKEADEKAAKEAAEKVLADAKAAEEAKGNEPEPEEADAEEELLSPEEKELLERKAKGDKTVGKLPWSTRVNKLTARLASEREARERLEARLAALEKGKPADTPGDPTPSGTPDLPGKPKRIDFQDDGTYVEKLIQWTKANEDYKEQITEHREHAGRIFKEHAERIDVARDQYDDWDDVAKGAEKLDMRLLPQVDFALREMPNSADILYHLAKNPKVFEKMSSLSPSQQVIEVGRISDRLAGANAGGNGNGKPRKIRAAAPEPITPGGRRPTPQGKKLDDMSPDEYYRARMAQRAQRRAN